MPDIKLSEFVASYLVKQGIKHVFGIIGSANAHIFDAVYQHPDLHLICLHHEQACVMAAHGYYMQSGNMAAVLVTAGAGTTNALTGIVGAWADSVPVLVLCGQESTKQFRNDNLSRMIGIQGVYTESIYKSCTKHVVTCHSANEVVHELAVAVKVAKSDRKGPCIVDIPIDLQSSKLNPESIKHILNQVPIFNDSIQACLKEDDLKNLVHSIKKATAPLLWLGNGLRRVPQEQLSNIVKSIGIPYLTSWTASDLLPPVKGLYAGHAGTYGGRAGNLILQSCDLLITLGTRLAIPQKGYVDHELARRAEIFVVDCDPNELMKLGSRFMNKFQADAPTALLQLDRAINEFKPLDISPWLSHIKSLKEDLPLVEACHTNHDWVDSYSFISNLGQSAPSNTTFVTDMGTALITAFQVLEPRVDQRLFTSQGLGEMGYGLPGAIGAWFADPSRNIICLNCDGGIMMNLQDLHSVISHDIPLKIVIFNNDGYLMIKHTQNAIVEGRRAGTDKNSGLSCPNYEPLVKAFGFEYLPLHKQDVALDVIRSFLDTTAAVVLEVFMDPNQLLVPKLSVSIAEDGSLVSPPLEDLSPLIPMNALEDFLLVPPHANSLKLDRANRLSRGDAIY